MNDKHHIQIKKDDSNPVVYLVIDGKEYELEASLARDVGDALYKTGCDVEGYREIA